VSKKILFVAAHYPNRSPGQRYRFEQYLNYLNENGFECKLAFIINKQDDITFYSAGKIVTKFFLLSKFFLKRIFHVFQATQYDVIYIFREAFFVGGPIFERLFKLTGKKIIFDFDDAIWLPNVSDENKKFLFLKAPAKTSSICKMANVVVTGNQYLLEYASQFNKNVVIIPSTIDMNYYRPSTPKKNKTAVTIGWSGSSTTVQHFETLLPVFEKLKLKYGNKIEFVLYGDPNYRNEKLGIKGIKWTHESEVSTIFNFDIGVMPLPDNQWTQGKCAMKGLQYMALKVPTIMAAVGVNKKIIQQGINGFLATTETEWMNCLEQLINDSALRNKIGEMGYQTVLNEYSVNANQKNYVDALNLALQS
jgi:glycosyltransferase involved in cell wall biosynthesis